MLFRLVANYCQCRGLGTELLRRILDVAQCIPRVFATLLTDNTALMRIAMSLGFSGRAEPRDLEATAEIRRVLALSTSF